MRSTSETEGLTVYLAMALIPACVLCIFYIYPLLRILIISFTEPSVGFGNYVDIASSSVIRKVIGTTLWICSLSTLVALFFGYLLSYAILHASPGWQRWMVTAVLLSFWVSILIRAFAWIALLQTRGIVNEAMQSIGLTDAPVQLIRNQIGVVIGMVHYLIPTAVMPLLASMRNIDDRYVMAARGLGSSPFHAFRKIYFPLTLPGVFSAGILVFIFSIGFYVTPALLGGGRVTMLAEYIAVQVSHTLAWGQGTALAASILAMVLILLIVMARIANFKKMFGAVK
ncbi:ABC transporter permease [Bosea sp. (in: a-proteobacteria)]|uniref:ABC transporter permease n=1 Tax=Bosea sp. (in: a-proteobacteria) TaxID=1871050 RepID=UPI00260841BE|nr:ABC transporter permease [Bosea sp. (in: a-proteobacteria)]MCO5091309.1 ABC transporter permease [Bosea sp. (in: a-proteobacteria)]